MAFERFILTIPVLGKVYDSFRKITDAIFVSNKKAFRKVVFVEYPRKGMYSLGFVTKDIIINKQKYASVFIPIVPIPMSGFLVHVKESQLIQIDMSMEEAIKLVVSGGILGGSEEK